ncbi:hypothetical protein [Streptomyces sp. NPDC091278]|uniref:hypothetical protein n=1 Tax=Streptomyces sp. NPDC091278 TaxID=3155301 RepID=UPI00344F928B
MPHFFAPDGTSRVVRDLSLLVVLAGMVALYFLARALWDVDDDQAVPTLAEAP